MRAVWPDELPVFFRTSATDWLSEHPGDDREGWTGDDTVRLARELRAHGVDLLDVSSGGMVPDAKVPTGPGYQVPFATRVREEVGLPTGAGSCCASPTGRTVPPPPSLAAAARAPEQGGYAVSRQMRRARQK